MWLGVRALKFSANAAIEEGSSEKPEEISSWMMTLNMIISFVFFVVMYKLVPLYLTTGLQKFFPALHGRIAFNLVDGVIRMAIFLGFLYMISRWKISIACLSITAPSTKWSSISSPVSQ